MSVSGDTAGLVPAFLLALEKMSEDTGTNIVVNSGRRTRAEQAALYQKYLNGTGNLAAPPGQSNHEDGLAADIAPGRETFGGVAGKYGLAFTVPSEGWHIELVDQAAANAAAMKPVDAVGDAAGTVTSFLGDKAGEAAQKTAAAVLGLLWDAVGENGIRILLYIVFVLGGAALMYIGGARALGLRGPTQEA